MFLICRTKRNAFTLLEVLAGLFIISVVIMVCVIKYDFKSDINCRNEINTLLSDLKTARSIAMNSGKSLEFKLNDGTYEISDKNNSEVFAKRSIKYGKLYYTDGKYSKTRVFIADSSAPSGFPKITYENHKSKIHITYNIATGSVRKYEEKK